MLSPEYLRDLAEPVLALCALAEDDILRDMARRIESMDFWVPSAQWQYEKLREAGRTEKEILKILSRYTGRTEAALRELMQQAVTEALKTDAEIHEAAGKQVPDFRDSAALRDRLTAGYLATRGTMRNLTRTTANTATQQFERALDRAWMQVSSGAFSHQQAVLGAIDSLAKEGIQAIRYPSGHTDTIETAVRRAVVTGVNQTALRCQETLSDEVGCDLVEVTAHEGARPSHAIWQGKIYSRSGESKKYGKLSTATGYGTGDGLGGWNCRHSFHPYYEGTARTWTDEQLEKLKGEDVTYNGEKMTEYDASQKQRYMERQLRRWKREYIAREAAGEDTGPAAAKIQEWNERQKDFLRQTGLKRQGSREEVAGWTGKKAYRAGKKADEASSTAERARLLAHNSNKVPLQALDAEGFTEKFHGITGKPNVDSAIQMSAAEMLKHRSGTNFEDLHLIDAETGNVLHRLTSSRTAFGVSYDDDTLNAIEKAHREGKRIIAVHNHPNGLPPTLDDGSSAFVHGYDQGVVVGHNLEVWTYGKTKRAFSSEECSAVHCLIAKKAQFSVELDDKVWYDKLKETGMEVERK